MLLTAVCKVHQALGKVMVRVYSLPPMPNYLLIHTCADGYDYHLHSHCHITLSNIVLCHYTEQNPSKKSVILCSDGSAMPGHCQNVPAMPWRWLAANWFVSVSFGEPKRIAKYSDPTPWHCMIIGGFGSQRLGWRDIWRTCYCSGQADTRCPGLATCCINCGASCLYW